MQASDLENMPARDDRLDYIDTVVLDREQAADLDAPIGEDTTRRTSEKPMLREPARSERDAAGRPIY